MQPMVENLIANQARIWSSTSYVDAPDSAGSFANGPSLAGASTHAAGTGNKYLLISNTHPTWAILILNNTYQFGTPANRADQTRPTIHIYPDPPTLIPEHQLGLGNGQHKWHIE